ncbi:MAG: carboxypeptidase-like regulatory domain-containing protein, partial [Acidobacteria bacterium]|nr:carboxypeptidase-like regulatory domain-containing protein [Acidobacteriota bacterium]
MRNSFLVAFSHRRIRALLRTLCAALFLALVSIQAHAQQASQPARASEDTNAATASGLITGRVMGDDGRPISDIQVTIFGVYSSISPRSTLTDAGGRFQFNELSMGLYTVRVALPAYIEMPDENRNPFEPKYLRPGDSAQVTLVKGGVITGTAMSAQGEPVIGAVVRAFRVRDAQ